MGLFLDLDPEEMLLEGNLDDPDLETELATITGNKTAAGGKVKPKGKSECCLVVYAGKNISKKLNACCSVFS